jgi:hypothetical protein
MLKVRVNCPPEPPMKGTLPTLSSSRTPSGLMTAISGAAAVTLRVSKPLAVPTALVALMLMRWLPGLTNVPLMMPVALSRLRPGGKLCAPYEVGELLATI